MVNIIPSVSPLCQVFGRIYWDKDLTILGEDMVDVQLPNGVLVSCGWYPEGSTKGRYRVTVSEGFHELHRAETVDPHRARFLVESLVQQFSSPGLFLSDSLTDKPVVEPEDAVDFGGQNFPFVLTGGYPVSSVYFAKALREMV